MVLCTSMEYSYSDVHEHKSILVSSNNLQVVKKSSDARGNYDTLIVFPKDTSTRPSIEIYYEKGRYFE